MDAKFAEIGLSRASVDTAEGKDHIYVRGPKVIGAGEDSNLTELSDHPAIWVELSWSQTP